MCTSHTPSTTRSRALKRPRAAPWPIAHIHMISTRVCQMTTWTCRKAPFTARRQRRTSMQLLEPRHTFTVCSKSMPCISNCCCGACARSSRFARVLQVWLAPIHLHHHGRLHLRGGFSHLPRTDLLPAAVHAALYQIDCSNILAMHPSAAGPVPPASFHYNMPFRRYPSTTCNAPHLHQ